MSVLGDTTVRIEALWPFPQQSIPESLFEEFEDKSKLPPILAKLHSRWSEEETAALFDGPGGDAEMAWEELSCEAINQGVSGFLCLAACPVFSGGSGSVSFSWGHYRTRTFFGRDAENAMKEAVAWAEDEYQKASQVSA